MPNTVDITIRSIDQTKPIMDKVEAEHKASGERSGDNFSKGLLAKMYPNAGFEDAGKKIVDDIGQGLTQELPDKVEKPIKDSGKKAGAGFASGMSPLLLSAFAGAAAIGPAALLAGTGIAVAGIGALISRSNADVQSEYKTMSASISKDLQNAVAPLAPSIVSSMAQVDAAVTKLTPLLRQTFADAAPDLGVFTQGVTGLAGNALPGLRDAIDQSRGIVSGFSESLPMLGTGVGNFFTGLTTNSQSTERGLVDFVSVASNALGTLGHVAGSAAAALSTDFAAITPVLNGALTAIDAVANPATIGALTGLGAAMKFDPAISRGIQGVSNSLTGVAAKLDGSTGLLGRAGGTAEKAASGFGKMADVMGGPWGIAIGAGVGLLGGLVSNLTQGVASVSDFTAAVQADNGVVGASTTAIIQKKLATLDLSTAQKDLGVSESTLIAYAGGDKAAQDQVRAAYTAKMNALDQSTKITEQNKNVTEDSAIAAKAQANELQNVMGSVEDVTNAVAGAVAQQNEQNKAYLAATRSAGIFAGMVGTATTALQTQANQQAINTVAALQLGAGQEQLDKQLSDAFQAFSLATGASSAYKSSLDALYNKYADYSQAQATFTEQLDAAAKALVAGKDAVDLNTDAGAKNFTTLNQLSQANEQVAESFIKQGGSVEDADKKLQAGAVAIDNMARKAGFSADQVSQLNMELYGTANIKDIHVNIGADTSAAINAVNNTLRYIDGQVAYVQVQAVGGGAGGRQLLAHGGAVGASHAMEGGARGNIVTVGEHGIEDVRLPVGSTVFSHEDTMSGRSYPGSGGSGGHITVEWVGGNANDALFELIREHIRFRAGSASDSVQRALGQTY